MLLILVVILSSAHAQDNNPPPTAGDAASIRGLFLPENLKPFSLGSMFLPISPDSSIPPSDFMDTCRRILQIDTESRVLIIGRAIGFAAADLAETAATVFVTELDSGQIKTNSSAWDLLGIENIQTVAFPESPVLPDFSGYDAILVHGLLAEISPLLLNALSLEGILLAPLSNPEGVQIMIKVEKTADGITVSSSSLSFFPNRVMEIAKD